MKAALVAVGIGLLGLHVAPAPAQSAGAVADSAPPAPDSAEQGKKKGGGLFGKARKLAGNKTVQQVAKTMACTVVPGGQVVAGAIDAASSDDVGEAAAGAAGAAAGQPCMPGALGMGEAPTSTPGMPGVAGLGGLAGAAGAAGAQGMSLGATANGMGGGSASGGMPAGLDVDGLAACMGLTTEEYLFMIDPTADSGREATKEELERQRRIATRVDPQRYQVCAMQQLGAGRPGMAAGGMPMPSAGQDEAPADGELSEAPGRPVILPDDLEADVRKGRLVVRDIDWLTGGAEIAEAGGAAYVEAMEAIAEAIGESGATWRADIYLDKRYSDQAAQSIGAARLTAAIAALEKAGLRSGAVTAGKMKKDKRPRLEIVRAGR